MKSRTLFGCTAVLACSVMLTGCRHPRSVTGTSATAGGVSSTRVSTVSKVTPAQAAAKEKKAREQAKRTLEGRVAELERTISLQKKSQARLDRELTSARQRLASTQVALRELQKKAVDSNAKIEASVALAASLREQMGGQHIKTIAALEAKAADEKKRSEKQGVIIQQREKEIGELRQAVSARDELLKRQPRERVARKPAVAPKQDSAKSPVVSRVTPIRETIAVPEPPEVVKMPVNKVAATPSLAVMQAPSEGSYISPEELMAQGNQLLREGKAAEAEQRFASALSLNPKLTDAKFGIASCRYTAGDFPEAKRLVGEVLRGSSRNAQAQALAGLIAWRQGDLRNASKYLSRAVKYDPKDAQLHSYMGIILYEQKKRDQAVKSLFEAVTLDPNLAEARFNLAIMLATDSPPKLDVAREHYQASLQLGNARDATLEKILYQ